MQNLSKTTFKMPVDLKVKVKEMAKSEGKTMSGLILEMLIEGLESRKIQ